MLTITSNEQAKRLVKNGVLRVDDDIEIAFNGFFIDADIVCHNILSKDSRRDINARGIDAFNIRAHNIKANDINAYDINAYDINAYDIKANDINAGDIDAGDIDALNVGACDINARDINYYAVCFAHENIICTSIKGGRENAKHFCLDGEITIKEQEVEELTMEEVCKELGRTVKIKRKA